MELNDPVSWNWQCQCHLHGDLYWAESHISNRGLMLVSICNRGLSCHRLSLTVPYPQNIFNAPLCLSMLLTLKMPLKQMDDACVIRIHHKGFYTSFNHTTSHHVSLDMSRIFIFLQHFCYSFTAKWQNPLRHGSWAFKLTCFLSPQWWITWSEINATT